MARHIEFGASPRATLGLVAAARALALMRGRDYVLPRDVADVAGDVLAHRLVLSFDAVAEGIDPRQIIDYLVTVVPQPQVAPHDQSADGARGAGARMRTLAESAATPSPRSTSPSASGSPGCCTATTRAARSGSDRTRRSSATAPARTTYAGSTGT